MKRLRSHGSATRNFVSFMTQVSYVRDYDVEIRADLKFTPEAQKKSEAMERMTLLAQNPFLAQNMRLQYEATKDVLVALGKEEWVQMMGAPPEAPPAFTPPAPPPEAGAEGGEPPPGE